MNSIAIYKLLPKTNCGKCGLPSCMGFAAKLATGQAKTDECPNMTNDARETLSKETQGQTGSRGTVFEQTLHALKPKLAALDYVQTAGSFGAALVRPDMLKITFLNDDYTVTREGIVDVSGREPTPFLSILIANHLCMPDPPPLSGEWITFSSVPASHAKDKAWAGHVEEVIARHFSGNTAGLKESCVKHGGKPAMIAGTHDAAYEFRFFPRYPALLLFYDAVPDEDFPAQVKLLLDRNVDKYLDLESIVVLGEEFASRLTAR